VTGGGKQGGILVRTQKDTASLEEVDRLSTGALVEELLLDNECGRLNYRRLSGTGPLFGWVSLKFKESSLLVKTDKQPAPSCWEVIGGGDSGGILVRTGLETTSPQESERLSTGAYVKELELCGERLHYQKLSGSGPRSGWVSLKFKGKELLVVTAMVAAIPGPETPQPERIDPEIGRLLGGFNFQPGQIPDLNARAAGEFYKVDFPFNPEQLADAGAEWLTKAFHLAGSLPKDNRVTKVSMTDFPYGAASVKVLLSVEYEKADDLHTELFVKFPLDPSNKHRPLNIGLAQESKEMFFTRFFARCMPFRTAKYYFGDFSMKTTNFIIITEQIKFADKAKKGQRLAPNEIEPIVRKCFDHEMHDPLGNYMALMRNAAKLTAWAFNGRMGSQVFDFWQFNKQILVALKVPEKQFNDIWPKIESFVLESAPKFFPTDIANPSYMAQFKNEVQEVGLALNTVQKYVTAGDLWGMVHPNLHIDNAFFYCNEDGLQECGLLDWGGVGTGFLLNCFVSGGGALPMATADLRIQHGDTLVRCYFETLHEFGGPDCPHFDIDDMCLRVNLLDMAYLIGMFKLIDTGKMGDIYDEIPKEQWKVMSGLGDPALSADTRPALMARSATNMLVESIKTWKGKDYYGIFSEWRAKNPK